MNNAEKRLLWFTEGAEALFLSGFSKSASIYRCPLCLNDFPLNEIEKLTFEHVPPRSLGGKELVLTCKDCNAKAGGKIGVDTHASTAAKILNVISGTDDDSHKAFLEIGDLRVNVRVQSQAKFEVRIPEEINQPGTAKQVLEFLQKDSSSPKEFRLKFPTETYSAKRANVSSLRSAYLVGFSLFGYKYILGEGFATSATRFPKPKENSSNSLT